VPTDREIRCDDVDSVADPDPVGSGPFFQDPDPEIFHRIPDPDPSQTLDSSIKKYILRKN